MLVPLLHVIQNQHIFAVNALFFHMVLKSGEIPPFWSVYLGKVLYTLLFGPTEVLSLP